MKAAIASKEVRASGESFLLFPVDENTYLASSNRVVSKTETLDGNVVVQDWGFAEGRKTINMTITLSLTDYLTLVEFQEDNLNEFLFHYGADSYVVIIRVVTKDSWEGTNVRASMTLDVVQKLNGDGEYTA